MGKANRRLVHHCTPGLGLALRRIWNDPNVQIAGRSGSVAFTGDTTTSRLCPLTGTVGTGLCSTVLSLPGGVSLPMYAAFPETINLFLNSSAPVTQDISVVTGSVNVSAIGSGYTIETAAKTATGSGFGAVTVGTGQGQLLTITGNGTITVTITGTPVGAQVNVLALANRSIGVVTAGASVTRTRDIITWTLADALTQTEDLVHIGAQIYASGNMGIPDQTWLQSATPTLSSFMIYGGATTFTVRDNDGGIKSDDISRTLPNKTITFLQRWKRRPNLLEAGYGLSVSGSPTVIGTGIATETINVGMSSVAGRESYASSGVIRFKGGAADWQIAALAQALHLTRTIEVRG